MSRSLVLHLPAFRLERCGWGAEELAGLIEPKGGTTRVVAVTPACEDVGVLPGMSATEARALCPEIALEPLDAAGERQDLLALAEACRALSDRVTLLGAESIALDGSRTAHLFGGEEGLLQQAVALLDRLGHRSRVVLADHAISAFALATRGDRATRLVPRGDDACALASLPLLALEPSPWLARGLAALGLRTVGELARLDAASIVGRFGAEGARLHRAAKGQGAPEPAPLGESAPPQVHLLLPEPVDRLEPLVFALRGLVVELGEQLFERDSRASRLALRLGLESGRAQLQQVRVGRATRHPPTLLRVVQARLETLRFDAPVAELTLSVDELTPDGGEQPGLHDRTQAAEPLPDLLARLQDALGEQAVVRPVLVSSWRPERAWSPAAARGAEPLLADPVAHQRRYEAALKLPRPTLLSAVPQPVQVREEAERPQALLGERGWSAVRRAAGPERLQGEWWAADRGFDRDYWVVDVDEGLAWIFRERGRWYHHGWFD